MSKTIPESFAVTERGVRKAARHCPHSIAFPSMMSALKTFMGLPPRLRDIRAHSVIWKADDDYYFQTGVSSESFGLLYGTGNVLKSGKWDNQTIRDSFDAEGIRFRLIADDTVPIKNGELNPDTIKDEITAHLLADKPAVLLRNSSYEGILCKLAIGYAEFGNVLTVGDCAKGVRIAKTAKFDANWMDKTFAVIFIDGITEPSDRKSIVYRALDRAHAMLTANESFDNGYGYGKQMWDKWISRLDDDANYRAKSHSLRYITPEKFDLAERRCYGADFFDQTSDVTGEDLSVAAQSFRAIHDKMWNIHWLVTGSNEGKLIERETRNKVIEILNECREFDRKSAENIKQVLNHMK